jgi:hypothetical protein
MTPDMIAPVRRLSAAFRALLGGPARVPLHDRELARDLALGVGLMAPPRQRRSVVSALPACVAEAHEHGDTEEATSMENIELKVEGKKLILTVDLTKEIGPSSSGKNTLIASTEGNANVPGLEGVKVGLYVYKAKKP